MGISCRRGVGPAAFSNLSKDVQPRKRQKKHRQDPSIAPPGHCLLGCFSPALLPGGLASHLNSALLTQREPTPSCLGQTPMQQPTRPELQTALNPSLLLLRTGHLGSREGKFLLGKTGLPGAVPTLPILCSPNDSWRSGDQWCPHFTNGHTQARAVQGVAGSELAWRGFSCTYSSVAAGPQCAACRGPGLVAHTVPCCFLQSGLLQWPVFSYKCWDFLPRLGEMQLICLLLCALVLHVDSDNQHWGHQEVGKQ